MRFVRVMSMAALVLGLVGSGEARAAAADPLKISVVGVAAGDKFSAYVGEGPATTPPEKAIVGQAMISYIVVKAPNGKPYAYVAKDVAPDSKDSVLVNVRFEVSNASIKELPFNFLDVGLRAKGAKTVGLGRGPVAFSKDAAGLKQVKKEAEPAQISPWKPTLFTYIFEVPKSSTSWMLTYKGKDVTELKGKEAAPS